MKHAQIPHTLPRFILPVILVLNFFVACQKENFKNPGQNDLFPEEQLSGAPGQLRTDYVGNEMLVKFKPGVTEDQRLKVLEGLKASVKERIFTKAMKHAGEKDGVYLLHAPLDVLTSVAGAKRFSEIEYAEPNYIYTHQDVSNDPYYINGSLWGMYGGATSFGTNAAAAWNGGKIGSNTVYIGIIDEGFMFNHEDLATNSWTNLKDPVNGIDDDGNGYIDDVRGWDFARNDNSVYDGSADDHGTHVAGTIGAIGGNGKGVAGVCWKVTMISGKFLGNRGGTTANAILAIDYFTDLKTRHGLNIVATNNSWGGGGFSQSLKTAIDRAGAANILFVAAAGNSSSNNDATASYPASYTSDNIISVASITSGGGLSSFSNYGATTVDIAAPGSGINSTLPTKTNGSTYGSYSGTSMATPHVTGAVALYKSLNPNDGAATIKAAILSSATPTPSVAGKCVTGGRLNVSSF